MTVGIRAPNATAGMVGATTVSVTVSGLHVLCLPACNTLSQFCRELKTFLFTQFLSSCRNLRFLRAKADLYCCSAS